MLRRLIAMAAAGAVLAGCGGDDTDPPLATTTTAAATTTTDAATTTLVTTSTSTATSTSMAPVTTRAGSTTTLAPIPNTTTGPIPTTTIRRKQRIAVGGPFGQQIELLGDQTVAATASGLTFDPSPVAVDTDNPVTTTLLGPESVCSSDDEQIFLGSGRIGDACRIRFQADAGDGYGSADYTLTLELASAGDISWTIASGPGQFECFEPNQPIDDLVLRPQAGSIPLDFHVGVVTADGIPFPSAQPDGDGVVVEFEPFPDSAVGSEARFSIGYQVQGQTIYVPDEDMDFEWSVRSACP